MVGNRYNTLCSNRFDSRYSSSVAYNNNSHIHNRSRSRLLVSSLEGKIPIRSGC
ncbi:unnamed protein product [Haemonchus placei]|uniref:Uncharacterized protein n=1 Tax=Haemonchus placei TaxID=6290 RepID=A0A0N4W040_HAEPC|nr:unnamed protein product [Haemonchus placei]